MPRTTKAVNGKTPEMWASAHVLKSLADGLGLTLPDDKHKNPSIPLSTRPFKTGNKNAVSVHRTFVRFMVPDWSMAQRLEEAGFPTKQNEEAGTRLEVFGANAETIPAHTDMFKDLLNIACTEAETRK